MARARVAAGVDVGLASVAGFNAQVFSAHAAIGIISESKPSRYRACHMDQHALGKKRVSESLINALQSDEFVLFAQTIISLDRHAKTPRFQEILVRFQQEEQMLLPPGSFIPVLESCGLMHDLDRWVVGRTVRWVRAFCKLRPDEPAPRNSINIASDTLYDQGFGDYVKQKIGESEVPASSFSFEIPMPEAARYASHVQALVALLKPLGCTFAFAAFDGSAAFFELLSRFQADFVKIGISLVGACDNDPLACRTLGALHRRCREIGVRTIAEHVECQETLQLLREIGVDYAQGYHTGMPHPLA